MNGGGRITGPGMGDDTTIGPVELSPGEVQCQRCYWTQRGGDLFAGLEEHLRSSHNSPRRGWWRRILTAIKERVE